MREFLRLSRKIGREAPHWVQGPGGNVSDKTDADLVIKASGLRLDAVGARRGWARLPRAASLRRLTMIRGEGDAAELAYNRLLNSAQRAGRTGGRPSMETGMHLVLTGRMVAHFHAHAALLMAHHHRRSRRKFDRWLHRNWPDAVDFVGPILPGLRLFRRIAKRPSCPLFLLENHGVLLQGDDDSILTRWRRLERRFLRDWNYPARAFSADRATPLRLYYPDSAVFLPRIRDVIRPVAVKKGEMFFKPVAGARRKDRDAFELWKATELLYHAEPTLAQLPGALATAIPDLPTEKFRRKR